MLLEAGEFSEKSFTSLPVTLYWNMVAPDTNVNSLVTIRFKQLPLDTNTTLPVQLNGDSSQVVIDVNMIPKQLYVNRLSDEEVSPQSNYAQGARDVGMLGIGLKNAETLKPDTIFVDQFLLTVKDHAQDKLVSGVQNIISRIRVVSYEYYASLNKPSGEPDEFANIQIDANVPNPIPINFSVLDTVTSGDVDKLVVLVDLASNAPNLNFTVGVQNIRAFQVVGGQNFAVNVTDSIGNPLSAITDKFESNAVSVISGDPEKIFANFPNPFGLDDGPTKFVFLMERPGDVDLRIFTLLGELVYSDNRSLDQGLYYREIIWDGRNDAGRLVLNGVYIAILKVSYTGGETKTYRTKVAFIK